MKHYNKALKKTESAKQTVQVTLSATDICLMVVTLEKAIPMINIPDAQRRLEAVTENLRTELKLQTEVGQ